jgi:hypothetical protein
MKKELMFMALMLNLISNSDIKAIEFSFSNLPIIVINTNGQTILNDQRIIANMDVIYNGSNIRNHIDDPSNNYSGKISIEIRGQSSASWAKKSYNLETEYDDGSNRNVSLLGLPKENDWILYAAYYDRSLIRDVLIHHWFRRMGWYSPRTKFCELMLNGNYQGIYILMEKIKIDKNRVNVKKMAATDIDDEDVTGGYIIKIDKEITKPGFNTVQEAYPRSMQRIRFQYQDPDANEVTPEQRNYIKNFIYDFESVMNSENYRDEQEGYSQYLDIDSFRDVFLINELTKNVDGYRMSSYFYKDRGGKLTAGPLWDFNYSFGNISYNTADNLSGWFIDYLTEDDFMKINSMPVPFWWRKLLDDPIFTTRLENRWHELRQSIFNLDSIYQYIDSTTDSLAEARERNFQIWIGPGQYQTEQDGNFPYATYTKDIKTYTDEINYLKNWIQKRMEWIDKNIHITSVNEAAFPVPAPTTDILMQNYPNPFNAITNIEFDLRFSEKIELQLYHNDATLAYSIAEGFFQQGHHRVTVDVKNLPSGIYVYQLKTESGSLVGKKMIVLK